MIHVVCLTKSYSDVDFRTWVEWYTKILHIEGSKGRLHIVDNESSVELQPILEELCPGSYTYEKVAGWPDQYGLYADILNENRFGLAQDDLIMFLDDDEFLYFFEDYDHHCFADLEDALRHQFNQLNCALIPQILMSSKVLPETRTQNVIEQALYRRGDIETQGKSIIRYDKDSKYRFKKTGCKENGHVPWINGIRMSDIHGGYGVSKTTYAEVDYNSPIQLYHYHMKSLSDWEKKINRGSAACPSQWYDSDPRKNKTYGGYDFLELSMYCKWHMYKHDK